MAPSKSSVRMSPLAGPTGRRENEFAQSLLLPPDNPVRNENPRKIVTLWSPPILKLFHKRPATRKSPRGVRAAEKDEAKLEHDKAETEQNKSKIEHDKAKTEHDKAEIEHGETGIEHDKTTTEHGNLETAHGSSKTELNKTTAEAGKTKAEADKTKGEQGHAKANPHEPKAAFPAGPMTRSRVKAMRELYATVLDIKSAHAQVKSAHSVASLPRTPPRSPSPTESVLFARVEKERFEKRRSWRRGRFRVPLKKE